MSSLSSSLRASILFLGGLCIAAGLAITQDVAGQLAWRGAGASFDTIARPELEVLAPRPLDAADVAAARTAWAYFATNTRPETGFADSVAGFPSTTLWDQGSHIMALVAAHRLEVLPREEFEARATRIVQTLAALPLVEGRLPNKAYDTQTLAMVDYSNQPTPAGIGWSALDLARLLLAVRVLEEEMPAMRPALRTMLKSWDIAALTAKGEIVGTSRDGADLHSGQEGRIGYEQYAARVLFLWGLDATMAVSAARILEWEDIEGVSVAIDLRSTASFGAIDPVLSEPYILMGLEMGLNSEAALLAARIYRAQEERFVNSGIPTMVSEDHIDQAPRFLYAAVYGSGTPWAVVSDDGTAWPELRTVSTKAVFGWDALYGTPYTAMLRKDLAGTLDDPTAGWAAGRYESDSRPNTALSLNTNAVILEALHFKAFGPLLSQ